MSEEQRQETPEQWKRRSFIAFGVLGAFGAVVYGLQRWISGAQDVSGVQGPLRTALDFSDGAGQLLKDDAHLAPEYPITMAAPKPRVNGKIGLAPTLDAAQWRLNVRSNGPAGDLSLTLDDLKALPRTEVCFDFKCIEGWNEISHWGGVRLSDLAEHYHLGTRNGAVPRQDEPADRYAYAALTTPDAKYYVGIDMKSAMHPQTILCYEMNRAPLTADHGAPLRLIIPTKYGVKNLKCIGTLAFTDERPPDYWAERGYGYDAGL
ncbi:MAG: molybdopterin-dependent oxidoreductase [Flavobacteriales bacterium]